MGHKPLNNYEAVERVLRIVQQVMSYSGTPIWLCFGALWARIMNNGVIPDGDFDFCTYHGVDYLRIEKAFKAAPGRYVLTKTLLDDTDQGKALYCSYGSQEGLPHICLSFWYLHDGIRYYCHDQHREIAEGSCGVPPSGYWFRGIPAPLVADEIDNFRMAEWPGVNQMVKVRVPRFPGMILDNMYPDWAYKMQHYEVKTGIIQEEKMVSYFKGGAISPYCVHVKSMNNFNNKAHVDGELLRSMLEWKKKLKLSR